MGRKFGEGCFWFVAHTRRLAEDGAGRERVWVKDSLQLTRQGVVAYPGKDKFWIQALYN